MSTFDDTHDFYLDGVDDTTAILPPGWRNRLVRFKSAGTRDIVTGAEYTGLCLDPHDLCVAKLCAGRDKDRTFVNAVIGAGLVDSVLVRERLQSLPEKWHANAHRAQGFIIDP